MNNNHIGAGLFFIAVCVGIGVLMAVAQRPADNSNQQVAVVSESAPPTMVEPAPPVQVAETFEAGVPQTEQGGAISTGQAERATAAGFEDVVTDSAGVTYSVTANSHGATLYGSGETIYLGTACDARSTRAGQGHWRWANGGFIVTFVGRELAFARQSPPMPDSVNIESCMM